MVIDANSIIIAILASILSGAGTALIAIINEIKKKRFVSTKKLKMSLKWT